MRKPYHIVNREEKTTAAAIEQFAKTNGQLLLPLVELIAEARMAVDEIIGVVGRKTIEKLPRFCAENAGPDFRRVHVKFGPMTVEFGPTSPNRKWTACR